MVPWLTSRDAEYCWLSILQWHLCNVFLCYNKSHQSIGADSITTTKQNIAVRIHDDVIKWKHFARYCPLCREFTGVFPSQGTVVWSFDVSFDLSLNKLLSKQLTCRWFETPSRSFWRHCKVFYCVCLHIPKGSKWLWHRYHYFLCYNYHADYQTKNKLCIETRGPFYYYGLTLIPAWISNHRPSEVWDEITYPFLNFNGATVEV